MSKFEWNQFGILKNCEELSDYIQGREYRHGEYCHYTSLYCINSILEKQQFYVNNVRRGNDECDKEQFCEDKQLYYVLCFSTGVNENLPLWYMYSGMKGKGGRIRFTKSSIKKLVKESKYYLYGYTDNEKGLKLDEEPIMTLVDGDSMELIFKDVLYSRRNDKDTGKIDLKYNTMTNHIMPYADFEKYNKDNKGFNKGLIWYYEKETRLLIKLTGDTAKKIEKDKNYMVVLDFSHMQKKSINIDLAPAITSADVTSELKKYNHIIDFMVDTSQCKLSKHKGEIKMNFCSKCDERKFNDDTEISTMLGKIPKDKQDDVKQMIQLIIENLTDKLL